MNTVDNELQELVKKYSLDLPQKSLNIEKSWKDLRSEWNSKNFFSFLTIIHNISGSAGVYGYEALSKVAIELNAYLSRFDYDIKPEESQMSKINELTLCLVKLAKESKPSNLIGPLNFDLSSIATQDIYLLDPDQNMWQKLDQLKLYGHKLTCFTEVESLLLALKEKFPLAVLINFDFLTKQNEIDATDELIALYIGKFNTIVYSNNGEFSSRLEAVRLGAKSFLLTPFSIDELLRKIENIKVFINSAYKVLIIDDDVDTAKFYANLLTKAKMQVKYTTALGDFEQELHSFMPDLILSDLNMPACSGVELASILRQQEVYEYLPILFLSSEEDKQKQITAMGAGADDFITKSTEPGKLIQIIENRAYRYKKLSMLMQTDNLTGALDSSCFVNLLEAELSAADSKAKNLVLAIAKIDNLTLVNTRYGYAAGDQLLRSLYLLLKSQLDLSCSIGRYGNDRFTILFTKDSLESIKASMQKISDNYKNILHTAKYISFNSTLTYGLAVFNKGKTASQLIEEANLNAKRG